MSDEAVPGEMFLNSKAKGVPHEDVQPEERKMSMRAMLENSEKMFIDPEDAIEGIYDLPAYKPVRQGDQVTLKNVGVIKPDDHASLQPRNSFEYAQKMQEEFAPENARCYINNCGGLLEPLGSRNNMWRCTRCGQEYNRNRKN